MSRLVTCPRCGGSGEELVDPFTANPPLATTKRCLICDGHGSIANPHHRSLAGMPEAVHPAPIQARRIVEDDSHTVVVDLTAQAGGLDGILADLARAIGEAGLMDEFRALHFNRSNPRRSLQALEALTAEPSIGDVLVRTITPEAAAVLRDALDEAQLEPDACTYPQCAQYAMADGFCGAHVDDAGLDDVADDAWLQGA